MRVLSAFLIILPVFTGNALADDGAILDVGGTIQPMGEHLSIRMVAEHVHARIFREYALVECVFFLQNEGPATIVEIGFPDSESESTNKPFERFESYINGVKADIRVIENKGQNPSIWYCKTVPFEEGETKIIRNVYKGRHSTDVMFDKWYTYMLHTGGSWSGTIGSVSVVITLEDFVTDRLFRIKPAGYEIDDREIRWTFTDYEPAQPRDEIEIRWNGSDPKRIWSNLHMYAALGDIEEVKALLEQGANIDSLGNLGRTPLVEAIFHGAGPEMVEFLIQNGASVESNPDKGLYQSPLLNAFWAHERFKYPFTTRVVELLIQNGAKVNRAYRYQIDRATGDLKRLLEDNYEKP